MLLSKSEIRKEYLSEKLSELMTKHNLKQSDVAEIVNGNQSLISKWLRKESFPTLEKIDLLTKYFNLPISYFDIFTLPQELYNEEIQKEKYHSDINFSREEKRIDIQKPPYYLPSEILVEIKIYQNKCYSDFVNNSYTQIMYIEENFLNVFYNIKTDLKELFAIRFQGNSMAPTIQNNYFVLGSKTSKVHIGELCFACLNENDEILIRRFNKTPTPSLIADNSQYSPIVGNDNFKIFGKVVGIIPEQKL